MASVANRKQFFEDKSKPVEKPKPIKHHQRKLSCGQKINCKIILPAGGIPKYIPHNRCKSPKTITCDQTKNNEPKIDKKAVA